MRLFLEMRKPPHKSSFPCATRFTLLAVLLAVSCLAARAGTTIFSHTFAGGSGALNGTPADFGSGAWIAADIVTAGGTFTTGAGSATLPLVPVHGEIYTLDARVTGVTGNANWVALGFANGLSSGATTSDRFISDNVIGTAWMLFRGDNGANANSAFLGAGSGTNGGTTNGLAWAAFNTQDGTTPGSIDLRILLDTTGGSGAWKVTWLAKPPAETNYTLVRPEADVLNEANFTSVGFAFANAGVNGSIESFSLSYTGDPPPPPSAPLEPLVSFIPVTDGDPATDENGYAGSAINSIAFAQDNLITVGEQQFISYYRRHATNSSHPANNTIVIGRRHVGGEVWEFFSTPFVSFNINDTHNVISMAIDGDGVIHMSWGMHGNSLLYAKSTTSVLGDGPIVMTSLGTGGMTGQESAVTYPKFLTLPDGDVLFLFRELGSGNGDWYLNRYDTGTDTWSPVHANGSGVAQPFFKGSGFTLTNCFYPDRLTLGPDGALHISGVFRYNSSSQAGQSGYQTNHRYVYMRSMDGGTTWQRSDGSTVSLPAINNAVFLNLGASHVPEIVKDLPEGHSIMNESGMTTDSADRPIIANWWADNASAGDHTRQYHIFFLDENGWHQRTLSARVIDNPSQKFSEGQLGSSYMGRPVVLTDAEDRIIVIYNDSRFAGITAVFSEPLAQDPTREQWTRINITHENLGFWEATYDEPRWKQDGVLQMLYQKLPGSGASYASTNNSTPLSVVEWDAHTYFNGPIRWDVDFTATPGHASISAPAYSGFRYDLSTSTDLDFNKPPAVTLPGDGFRRDFGTWPLEEPRRFWRMERVEEASGGL